jgi:ABC-type multidrug transport system permease subunit
LPIWRWLLILLVLVALLESLLGNAHLIHRAGT